MSDYKRLTTNEPEDNVETMLNYARCKDKEVFIYDEQGNEVKLTEYIAKHAQEECEVTAEDVMEGCCFECMDCPLGILNTIAIQAAELRHRLSELEDKLEAGKLVELPCKVGDIVYCLIAHGTHGTVYTTGAAISRAVTKIIWDGRRFEIYSERSHIWSNDYNECNYYGYLGETVFLTREAAEEKLKELEKKLNELSEERK